MSSVDVIVPCYRYGHYLRECVSSVLAQIGVSLRVLIIDDESPDNTAEVGAQLAREDARVTFLRHAVNQRHIATYNEGIDWARADYLLLLSADDYLLPGSLKRAVDLMDRRPAMGLCFGEAIELRDDGRMQPMPVEVNASSSDSTVLSGPEFVMLCAQADSNNIVPTPTAVVRTRLLKQLGSYRPDLPHAGDFEMWLRLAAHAEVGVIHEAQAVYRRHSANMSLAYAQENCISDVLQRKAAIEVILASPSITADSEGLHAALAQGLARSAVALANSAINAGRVELSDTLSGFALSLHKPVRWSWDWRRLHIKRLLGPRVCGVLQPAYAYVRNGASRIRV